MKVLDFLSLSVIILIAFFVNYHYGHQGLMPLDDLQNFNSGFRVLNGDFPFRDYYSITGPILDIWQSNIYNLFGVSWKSFILHASILNSLYAISLFIFLRNLSLNTTNSIIFSISACLLMYPPTGNPTVEHNSLTLSLVGLMMFIVGLKDKKNFILFCSIIIFGISFFTKQVPTSYLIILCVLIYFSQMFGKVKISNLFFLLISVSFTLLTITTYFYLKNVQIEDVFNQYFVFSYSLGQDRFQIINFKIIYENISKIFFLAILTIPSIYLYFLSKYKTKFLIIIGLNLIIVIYEIHSQNQPITFSLLPLILSLFYFFYKEEKLDDKFINYFFYIIIIYAFFRILRYELFYLLAFIVLSIAYFVNKKKFIYLVLTYLFITTCFYFEKYVKIRAWDDLAKNDLEKSFDASIIDKKLSGLKWSTVYFEDKEKEKNIIINNLNFFKKLDNSIKFILVSDYQIYNPILNKKDYSPVKYWFINHTYPDKNHTLRGDFDSFFKNKILSNNISLIIFDNTAEFKDKDLINFNWLYKCSNKKIDDGIPSNLKVFEIDTNCIE